MDRIVHALVLDLRGELFREHIGNRVATAAAVARRGATLTNHGGLAFALRFRPIITAAADTKPIGHGLVERRFFLYQRIQDDVLRKSQLRDGFILVTLFNESDGVRYRATDSRINRRRLPSGFWTQSAHSVRTAEDERANVLNLRGVMLGNAPSF